MRAYDSSLLASLRDEFNAQPIAERFRTGRFMDYEAVMELLREREHAMAAVRRIDGRIAVILESTRKRNADSDRQVARDSQAQGASTVSPAHDERGLVNEEDCALHQDCGRSLNSGKQQ